MKNSTFDLHQKILKLVSAEKKILVTILSHLEEINRRKLFLEFGHDSLLKYCVKELGYSESAAFRRIKALRLGQSVPEVARAIENGSLNLSQVATAQSLFEQKAQDGGRPVTPEKKAQVLQSLAELKLGHHDFENRLRQELDLPRKPRRVILEMQDACFQRWVRFKGQMVHKAWSDERLLGYLLDLAEAHRLRDAAPMRRKILPRTSLRQRHIPAYLKRELLARAKHCEHPGCQSTYGLEIDHIRPIAQGGSCANENLQLLCRHHNQYRATSKAP